MTLGSEFGDGRFREACEELNSEIVELFDSLKVSDELEKAHKETAHKLCGSAAILGQDDLWSKLNDIQNCSPQEWVNKKATLLRDLERSNRIPSFLGSFASPGGSE